MLTIATVLFVKKGETQNHLFVVCNLSKFFLVIKSILAKYSLLKKICMLGKIKRRKCLSNAADLAIIYYRNITDQRWIEYVLRFWLQVS